MSLNYTEPLINSDAAAASAALTENASIPASTPAPALRQRLRDRLDIEYRDHPFPETTEAKTARERAERWEAVVAETWHGYAPSRETERRRMTELAASEVETSR
ncbi:hypothetical protein [Leucobacter sp. USHLN153]|uniref:hypothetical protein n=1 Tax=Leucobacter sp. USHLN153 TaxID=3081268 RepID=UPI0030165740